MNAPPPNDPPVTQSSLESALARLEEHLKELMAASDKRIEQRFADMEKAVTKAETASEKRFEGVNEFRRTLDDQQRTLMPRPEAEMATKAIESRLTVQEKLVGEMRAKSTGGQQMWGYLVGAIGTLLAILSFIFARLR